MPVAGPNQYIDKKTGELRRLQSFRDYILTEALPTAAHIGLLGLKGVVVYSVFGPLGLLAPAAGYLVTRQRTLSSATRSHNENYDSPIKEDALSRWFDLNDAQDRQAFTDHYGLMQPNLMIDVLHMTKTLGMEELPIIEIIDPANFDVKKGELDLRNLHASLAMTCRPDGKRPVLIIGAGAMESMKPDEMRCVVAHEMTHAKLNHTRQKYLHTARRVASRIFNVLLVGGIIFGALPILPTLGFIAVTNLAQHTVENIRSRRHEHLCDQGAALITGQTKEFTSAMNKISRALAHLNTSMANRKRVAKGLPEVPLPEPGKLLTFIFATHPDDDVRLKRIADFGQKYPDFCAQQKSKFAETFNKVAAAKKKPPQAIQAPQRRF